MRHLSSFTLFESEYYPSLEELLDHIGAYGLQYQMKEKEALGDLPPGAAKRFEEAYNILEVLKAARPYIPGSHALRDLIKRELAWWIWSYRPGAPEEEKAKARKSLIDNLEIIILPNLSEYGPGFLSSLKKASPEIFQSFHSKHPEIHMDQMAQADDWGLF
jgi:hypothetical protein